MNIKRSCMIIHILSLILFITSCVGKPQKKAPLPVTEQRATMYNQAKALFSEKRYKEGKVLLEKLTQTNYQDEITDDSLICWANIIWQISNMKKPIEVISPF